MPVFERSNLGKMKQGPLPSEGVSSAVVPGSSTRPHLYASPKLQSRDD